MPDLASADPEIAPDGKTVTVKLRKGVMFSDPVDREVTSADVKYAIERAFTSTSRTATCSRTSATSSARRRSRAVQGGPGIETPGRLHDRVQAHEGHGRRAGGRAGDADLIPVPKEFATKYDKQTPSTYGEQHAVFTGPYKVEGDAQGKVTASSRGSASTSCATRSTRDVEDFRPAFLDAIEFQAGNDDTAVATRRILSGESLASGDFRRPRASSSACCESNKPELSAVPGGGWRAISLDTSRPPFDDLDVRKAVIAGFDRTAVRQQRGGEALGPIAQHWIPPGMAGFEESDGLEGWPEFDWMRKPEGDRALSAEYFKKAGSHRASTRAARRCCSSPTTPTRTSRSRRSPSASSTRWASRRSSGWSRATRCSRSSARCPRRR